MSTENYIPCRINKLLQIAQKNNWILKDEFLGKYIYACTLVCENAEIEIVEYAKKIIHIKYTLPNVQYTFSRVSGLDISVTFPNKNEKSLVAMLQYTQEDLYDIAEMILSNKLMRLVVVTALSEAPRIHVFER